MVYRYKVVINIEDTSNAEENEKIDLGEMVFANSLHKGDYVKVSRSDKNRESLLLGIVNSFEQYPQLGVKHSLFQEPITVVYLARVIDDDYNQLKEFLELRRQKDPRYI